MNFSGRFADRILNDKIHKISLAPLVDKLSKQFGGTAANIAYNLKLLGLEPYIVSAAGSDFGLYEAFLKKQGIDTSGIKVYPKEYTGMYFVVTDHDDNQIGAFHMGATKFAKDLSVLQGDPLQDRKGSPYGVFAILAPTQKDAMVKYFRECKKFQISYLFDPAFQIGDFTPEELKEGIEGSAITIGNDYEISLMESRLGISHEELLLMTPVLVTTLAGKGSIIETRKEAIHIPPAKAKNVSDPTGAGDAYRAGFVTGYLKFVAEKSADESLTADELMVCGQMGSVSSVYTVEKYGTVTHTYTKEQFQTRFKENFGAEIQF